MGIIFLYPFLTHFSSLVLNGEKKYRILIWVSYSMASIFTILLLTTNLVLDGTRKYFWGYYTNAGVLLPIYISWCIGISSLMIFNLYYFYKLKKDKLNTIQTNQIKYFLLGFFIFSSAQVDYIANFGIEFYPFGYLSAFLFTCSLGYSIIKYKFLDIETAIHKTAMWFTTSILLFLPVFLFYYFLWNYIRNLGILWNSLIMICLVFIFVRYYNFLQPKIDRLFRRKAHDLEKNTAGLVENATTILEMEKLTERIEKGIKSILFSKKTAVFIRREKFFVTNSEKMAAELSFVRFLENTSRAIEKDVVMVDPQYGSIKNECVEWMEKNEFDVLVPAIVNDQLVAIICIGKKESLQQYMAHEIGVLEKLGKSVAVSVFNAFEHENLMSAEKLAREKLERFSKELEEKVEERTAELKEKNETISNMNQELAKANIELKALDVQKDEFISLAAHELKTPLTSIKGFAQLLQNEVVLENKEKRKHYLDLINKNTIDLYNLILDLVDSSRISVGKLSIDFEDVNVYDIFKEINEDMELVIKEKNVTPVFEIQENLPRIKADYHRVLQTLRNLLINAVHYTEQGSITLKVSRKENFVEFAVIDTGQGIPEESKQYIFSKFYQVDSSLTRKVKGSGLGLSICKGLVELMKGKIWFESEFNKGTTFYFNLPVVGDSSD